MIASDSTDIQGGFLIETFFFNKFEIQINFF